MLLRHSRLPLMPLSNRMTIHCTPSYTIVRRKKVVAQMDLINLFRITIDSDSATCNFVFEIPAQIIYGIDVPQQANELVISSLHYCR